VSVPAASRDDNVPLNSEPSRHGGDPITTIKRFPKAAALLQKSAIAQETLLIFDFWEMTGMQIY
jgi:hypothetical protein